MPLISVVMPARNAQKTLAESLDSLVAQTFRDFELVLVDDGSTDSTSAIAASYADRLPMRLLRHDQSQGVARSINDGLAHSDSEFVARLDADDLAQPNRLERQLEFMQQNASVGICGSDIEIFSDDSDLRLVPPHPTASATIRTALVQRNPIAHPSVMLRRQALVVAGNYDERFDFAEDYELWCRASLLGVQFANIPEPLTRYRRHASQVSREKAQLQYERDIAAKQRYIGALMQGEQVGLLPQFLAPQTRFPDRVLARAVLQQCGPAMTMLARHVADAQEYGRIVTSSLLRHLG